MAFIKDGTEGSPTNPIYVQPTDGNGGNGQTDAHLVDGDAHIGTVALDKIWITVQPTLALTEYGAGTVVGGLQSFPNAVRLAEDILMLQTCVIASEVPVSFDVIFFRDNPTAADTGDGDTFAFNGSIDKYVGNIIVASSNSAYTWNINMNAEFYEMIPLDTTTLYFVLVTTGPITYTNAAGLYMHFGFQR